MEASPGPLPPRRPRAGCDGRGAGLIEERICRWEAVTGHGAIYLGSTAYFKYRFNLADTGMAAEGIENLICSVSAGDRFICNVMN